MNKAKIIVVTGANGLIGNNFCKLVKSMNFEVRLFDRNIHNFGSINSLMPLIKKADFIVHLAGEKSNDPVQLKFNIESLRIIIQAANKFSPSAHIIFPSSFAVYKPPLKNQVVSEDFDLEPRNAYGESKLLCEEYLTREIPKTDLKATLLRFANVYGKNVNPKDNSLITHILTALKEGSTLVITGDGWQIRDFLHVGDAASAVLAVILKNSTEKTSIYNICSGRGVSINEVVSMVERVSGKKLKTKFIEAKSTDLGYFVGSFEKAERKFNWTPKITLTRGLRTIFGHRF
ncbi:MAG: NAD-dependent epimerase/dehydratase family protein [Candidatus Curtissbacteria bacterium]|nr:NAD-dependent epimerase/dehydratase family protein [Candidatus Curtissbacteria bacterium]